MLPRSSTTAIRPGLSSASPATTVALSRIRPYPPAARVHRQRTYPLVRNGVPISTIDFLGDSFVLLIGSRGQRWRQAADQATHHFGIQVAVHEIGVNGLGDPTGTWTIRYQLTDSDAVLIRPDHFLAWRSTGHSEPKALQAALERALDRRTHDRNRQGSR
jgi:2,4-dichlorophenol 6-monooxygenase